MNTVVRMLLFVLVMSSFLIGCASPSIKQPIKEHNWQPVLAVQIKGTTNVCLFEKDAQTKALVIDSVSGKTREQRVAFVDTERMPGASQIWRIEGVGEIISQPVLGVMLDGLTLKRLNERDCPPYQ